MKNLFAYMLCISLPLMHLSMLSAGESAVRDIDSAIQSVVDDPDLIEETADARSGAVTGIPGPTSGNFSAPDNRVPGYRSDDAGLATTPVVPVDAGNATAESSGGSRWLWIAIAVAVAFMFLFRSKRKDRTQFPYARTDTAVPNKPETRTHNY